MLVYANVDWTERRKNRFLYSTNKDDNIKFEKFQASSIVTTKASLMGELYVSLVRGVLQISENEVEIEREILLSIDVDYKRAIKRIMERLYSGVSYILNVDGSTLYIDIDNKTEEKEYFEFVPSRFIFRFKILDEVLIKQLLNIDVSSLRSVNYINYVLIILIILLLVYITYMIMRENRVI